MYKYNANWKVKVEIIGLEILKSAILMYFGWKKAQVRSAVLHPNLKSILPAHPQAQSACSTTVFHLVTGRQFWQYFFIFLPFYYFLWTLQKETLPFSKKTLVLFFFANFKTKHLEPWKKITLSYTAFQQKKTSAYFQTDCRDFSSNGL